MYVCPYCGLSEFESKGNETECKKCHRKITYGEDKEIRGIGFDFPFASVAQWYDYQKDFVCALDVTQYTREPLYRDTASLSQVIVYQRKVTLRETAAIALYGDRVVIDEGGENSLVMPFEAVTAMSVLGRNKLNIYFDKKVYQFKGSKRFNALKYVNIYFRHKNMTHGEEESTFLGL